MATVGDLKVERLLERIAAMERRHAEEMLNLEVEYVLKMSAMIEEKEKEESEESDDADENVEEDNDAELEPEEVQGSDSSTADGDRGSGQD